MSSNCIPQTNRLDFLIVYQDLKLFKSWTTGAEAAGGSLWGLAWLLKKRGRGHGFPARGVGLLFTKSHSHPSWWKSRHTPRQCPLISRVHEEQGKVIKMHSFFFSFSFFYPIPGFCKTLRESHLLVPQQHWFCDELGSEQYHSFYNGLFFSSLLSLVFCWGGSLPSCD